MTSEEGMECGASPLTSRALLPARSTGGPDAPIPRPTVIAGLVPAIHPSACAGLSMDHRDKPGDDDGGNISLPPRIDSHLCPSGARGALEWHASAHPLSPRLRAGAHPDIVPAIPSQDGSRRGGRDDLGGGNGMWCFPRSPAAPCSPQEAPADLAPSHPAPPSLPGLSRQSMLPLARDFPWITGTSPVMTIGECPTLPQGRKRGGRQGAVWPCLPRRSR